LAARAERRIYRLPLSQRPSEEARLGAAPSADRERTVEHEPARIELELSREKRSLLDRGRRAVIDPPREL
jgi:hypothetical protein